MLRSLAIAAAATIALGTAALTPTAASAGNGWRHHHHSQHHHRWHGPRFVHRAPVYAAYNSCLRTRWVPTPWGPRRRVVNVCY
jgi:hypothetical protein